MSASSRFVYLTDSILLEYIYYDNSDILNVGNEWVKNTSNDAIWKLINNNDNSISFFNGDSSKNISIPIGTGNVRDYSYAAVNPKSGKYALLDIDKLLFYNDFDPNLTNSSNLPINFLNGPYGIIYDKIRLHCIQNFDFEGWEGFVFDLSVPRKDEKLINLCKLAFLKNSFNFTLNPTPFVFSEKFFTSYFEFYVPSFYKLKRDYYLSPLTGDTPTERISDFIGWKKEGFLNFSFGWIENIESINSQDYVYIYRRKVAVLPERDPFESIGAEVIESLNGDYLELYPTYNGSNAGNFLNDLNSVGNDYILIHDIVVSEYIGNGFDKTLTGGYWTITNNLSISQDSSFDQPIMFRPIIFNSNSAVAYKIDYIVRFYDRNTNTQIWKRGSFISFNVRKYGKKLSKIDLGSNRPSINLYNQIINKSINLDLPNSDTDLSPIRDVISFAETINVAASYTSEEPANTSTQTTNLLNVFDGLKKSNFKDNNNSSDVYTNGLARILIADSGNFNRFVFKEFNKNLNQYKLKDLSGFPNLRLRFYRKDGSYIEVYEMVNTKDNRSLGEISFDISLDVAKRLKVFDGRSFNIVYVEEKSLKESVMYSGQFLLQNEYIQWKNENEVNRLNSELNSIKQTNKNIETELIDLKENYEDLKNENALLKKSIDSLNNTLLEAKRKLDEKNLLDSNISNNIESGIQLANKEFKSSNKDISSDSVEKKYVNVINKKANTFTPKVKKK